MIRRGEQLEDDPECLVAVEGRNENSWMLGQETVQQGKDVVQIVVFWKMNIPCPLKLK